MGARAGSWTRASRCQRAADCSLTSLQFKIVGLLPGVGVYAFLNITMTTTEPNAVDGPRVIAAVKELFREPERVLLDEEWVPQDGEPRERSAWMLEACALLLCTADLFHLIETDRRGWVDGSRSNMDALRSILTCFELMREYRSRCDKPYDGRIEDWFLAMSDGRLSGTASRYSVNRFVVDDPSFALDIRHETLLNGEAFQLSLPPLETLSQDELRPTFLSHCRDVISIAEANCTEYRQALLSDMQSRRSRRTRMEVHTRRRLHNYDIRVLFVSLSGRDEVPPGYKEYWRFSCEVQNARTVYDEVAARAQVL
jgi:hypothetical protein